MKNTLFLFVAAILFSFSALAQKKHSHQPVKQLAIPSVVDSSFKNLYADPTAVKWEKNYSGNYVARFNGADSLQETAEFSRSGALIKVKTMLSPMALPEVISTSLAAEYPVARVTEVTKLQMPGVSPYYKVDIISADNKRRELLVSEEGTITE